MIKRREPAIRQRVEQLRAANPDLSQEQLARKLIASVRRRVAGTGAASGAAAIAPGLGTLVTLGTSTSQALYALEQETELVLSIAIIYGRELADSEHQLMEALAVIGLAGGAVKLREDVLVAGGRRITIAAFRRVPTAWLERATRGAVARVLGRAVLERAAAATVRTVPLAIGLAVGAGFDLVAVTLLGRAAIRYYSRAGGGPADSAGGPQPPAGELPKTEDLPDVEAGG